MILMSEIARSLPNAATWYHQNEPDCRLRIDVNLDREPPTLSRRSPSFIGQFRTIEFRVVQLIRDGGYVYDWEMLV
jgi:hypothetical protein